MSGPLDVQALQDDMGAARGAAEALAGRPMAGLRAVRPGTGGRAWMVAFDGPEFLCMNQSLAPVADIARVRDVAQALLASELVDEMVDAPALRALRPHVDVLARFEGDLPAAVQALRRAADACDELAAWRDQPERIVASLVDIDAAVLIQARAHSAYATFSAVTEPLVARQQELPADLLAALVAVEQGASDAGLGMALGKVLGEGMPGIVEAADEMAAAHITPLR